MNEIIIAVIALLGSVITAWITVSITTRSKKSETDASASSSNVLTALKLKDEMEQDVEAIRRRCDTMESQLAAQNVELITLSRRVRVMSKYARSLIIQIEEIGVVPVVTLEQIEAQLRNGGD